MFVSQGDYTLEGGHGKPTASGTILVGVGLGPARADIYSFRKQAS